MSYGQLPLGATRQPPFRPYLDGPLQLVTAPTGQPLTLAQARTQTRMDADITADDAYLTGLIDVAARFCESQMGTRQFLTATWDLPIRQWWGGWVGGFPGDFSSPGLSYGLATGDGTLRPPRPPLQSVTAITYYDTAGTLQTLDPSQYIVRTPWRQPGEIDLVVNVAWPALSPLRKYPINVRFVAGYGAAADVPATIQQAMLLVIGWLYRDREPTAVELAAVAALLECEGYGAYA